MPVLHEVLETAHATLDRLEVADLGMRLEVARTGAEMVGLQRRGADGCWHGFLYRDGIVQPPDRGWANHATVMGYFLHRLWNEQSVYRGQVIRGGTHGFVRHFRFDPPVFDPAARSLTYLLPAARIPAHAYPLRVALRLTYRVVAPGAIEVVFEFSNEEDVEAHLSFGLHPGFALDDPATAEVLLPPGRYLRHFAPDNFLDGRTMEINHPGGPMPFPWNQLPGSFLLGLAEVPDRIFEIRDPASGRRIRLDFGDCPCLTVWSDLHAFVCVEPCWGLPDSNPPVPFERKAGIQTIAPRGTLKKTLRLLPEWQNKQP